eukprot:scaffold1401_cov330-Pavlova_lutheri.AAC.135
MPRRRFPPPPLPVQSRPGTSWFPSRPARGRGSAILFPRGRIPTLRSPPDRKLRPRPPPPFGARFPTPKHAFRAPERTPTVVARAQGPSPGSFFSRGEVGSRARGEGIETPSLPWGVSSPRPDGHHRDVRITSRRDPFPRASLRRGPSRPLKRRIGQEPGPGRVLPPSSCRGGRCSREAKRCVRPDTSTSSRAAWDATRVGDARGHEDAAKPDPEDACDGCVEARTRGSGDRGPRVQEGGFQRAAGAVRGTVQTYVWKNHRRSGPHGDRSTGHRTSLREMRGARSDQSRRGSLLPREGTPHPTRHPEARGRSSAKVPRDPVQDRRTDRHRSHAGADHRSQSRRPISKHAGSREPGGSHAVMRSTWMDRTGIHRP